MVSLPQYRNALPPQTTLHEYRIEQVLGAGGFVTTYLARDTHLDKPVAIKEYFPSDIAMRAAEGTVQPATTEREPDYKWGLDRFLQEARTLARFSHPNIVRVIRYFEANGTAYMVMDYERGEPGPWTDRDALGGVFYRCLTGTQPPDAVTRMRGDTLADGLAKAASAYSAPFLRAIGWALALDEKKRPQSVDAWRAVLLAAASGPAVPKAPPPAATTERTLRVERPAPLRLAPSP